MPSVWGYFASDDNITNISFNVSFNFLLTYRISTIDNSSLSYGPRGGHDNSKCYCRYVEGRHHSELSQLQYMLIPPTIGDIPPDF